MVKYEARLEGIWRKRRSHMANWLPEVKAIMGEVYGSPHKIDQVWCGFLKALVMRYKGNYRGVFEVSEDAMTYFKQEKFYLWQGRLTMIMAFAKYNLGYNSTALEMFQEALRCGRKSQDMELQIFMLNNIAIINRMHFKHYDKAMVYFHQALDLSLSLSPPHHLTGKIYSGLSKCEMYLGAKDAAEDYAEAALTYAEKYGDERTIAWAYEQSTVTYHSLGKLDKALHYGQKNLVAWQALEDPYSIALAYVDLAQVYGALGVYDLAVDYGLKAMAANGTLGSKRIEEHAVLTLAEVYYGLEDYKKSADYYKAYSHIRNKLLEDSLDKEISRFQAELDLEKSIRDMEIYRLKHVALKEAQEALVRSEKMSGLLGLISGVAHEVNTPLGNAMMMQSYIEKKNKSLKQMAQDKSLTYRALMDHIDDGKEALDTLQLSLKSVIHIVESFKQISIHPQRVKFKRVKVNQYLSYWLKYLSSKGYEDHVDLEIQCPDDLEMCMDVFELDRILNELYINAVKHGFEGKDQDRKICIRVYEDQGTCVEFIDNGCGISIGLQDKIFEPFVKDHQESLGLGLHVVYNIVYYLLLGTLDIESSEGQGTKIRMVFPSDHMSKCKKTHP